MWRRTSSAADDEEQVAPLGPVAPGDAGAQVRETHSGLVLFSGDRAYKFKKAVDLGFLDFRSADRRLQACRDELGLNRRLSPDVYLGVATMTDETGQAVDHALVMRRLPAERSLAACIERGEDLSGAIRSAAHQLAGLHASSPGCPPPGCRADAEFLADRWEESFDTLDGSAAAAAVDLDELRGWVQEYLAGRQPLFADRTDRGRFVDGHGDLQCSDIFSLDDGVRILDCLDFDPTLRWGDGLLDAAFLAMDLERLGRPVLAQSFLEQYGELLGDSWPASLAHHFVAYRALVRAKVAVLRSAQTGGPDQDLVDLTTLAAQHLQRAQVRLTLIGGLPGTGKTTLAKMLGNVTGSVVLSSDEARDDLAGEARGPAPVDQGRYSPAARRAVYNRLLDEALVLLSHGEDVVLDASWSDAEDRKRARAIAAAASCATVEIRCVAPAGVAEHRIRRRLAEGHDRSDATPAVARAMAGRFDAWPEAAVASTGRPLGSA